MSRQTWQETLATAQTAGSAFTSNVAASILPSHARVKIPANFLQIGTQFKIEAAGRISNVVTTPGTLTLDVRMGPTSNIIVFNGGAMQMSTTAHTNVPWWFEVLLTCRAVGSGTSANLMGQAKFTSQAISATAVADSATTHGTLMAPNTAPAVGTGFDSTVDMWADLFATFSLNATNSIQVEQYSIWALN